MGADDGAALASGVLVGVRFALGDPVVFCRCSLAGLTRGTRVRVARGDGTREGTVAIEPAQILAAPPLDDAPWVVETMTATPCPVDEPAPRGVAFLPAESSPIGVDDLREALRLAALPIPEPPLEQR